MQYVPDVLGSGFEAARLQMEPDRFSARSATLVRYLPSADPQFFLPDRVVPDNLRPGGAPQADSFTILPPCASPQQCGKFDSHHAGYLAGLPAVSPSTVTEPLTDKQQRDLALLQDYLGLELRGRGLNLAENWGEATVHDPKFILVYIHGWNDYFYQTHLARSLAHLGAAFYALDLHRYGRNMPDWSGWEAWNCYTEDFKDYDPEIDWALASAREEHPGLPVIVMGHSNGGGVVSGWAARHHDSYDGLIFNSPWIVQDVSEIPAGEMVRDLIADRAKRLRIPLPQGNRTTYSDSLVGYRTIGSPLPRRVAPFQNDPSIAGWIGNPKWRNMTGAPTIFAWVSAVLRNQRWLHEQAAFPEKPVLCLTANHELDPLYEPEVRRIDYLIARKWKREGKTPLRQHLEANRLRFEKSCKKVSRLWRVPQGEPVYRSALVGWTEAARHIDTVLNGELIEQRARELFQGSLTVRQLSGYHDLTLSQPLERAEFFAEISQWLTNSQILGK